MYEYKRCSEVSFDDVYKIFKVGFSDYMIKTEFDKDTFKRVFFGVEGNSIDTSFIAFDGQRPIGLILGGIKIYEGIKTLRCGTMCIDPEYRGKGAALKLFELHKSLGEEEGCRQLFLEVIASNDRAVNFYKKVGYEKVYDLKYFNIKENPNFRPCASSEINIKEIDFKQFKSFYEKIEGFHINWQNDIDYIEKLSGNRSYAAIKDGEILGVLNILKSGRMNFIYVNRDSRLMGIASGMLHNTISELELELKGLNVCTTNNAFIEGFLNKTGFVKDKLSQYEMYYTL